MYYNVELVMAGAILLTAMLIGGIALRIKRRREGAAEETDLAGQNTWPENLKDKNDTTSD